LKLLRGRGLIVVSTGAAGIDVGVGVGVGLENLTPPLATEKEKRDKDGEYCFSVGSPKLTRFIVLPASCARRSQSIQPGRTSMKKDQ